MRDRVVTATRARRYRYESAWTKASGGARSVATVPEVARVVCRRNELNWRMPASSPRERVLFSLGASATFALALALLLLQKIVFH